MALVLIDNYDSFTYNLFQMLQVLIEKPVKVFRNDKIDFPSLKAMEPTHVVLSPGPGHPGNEGDFGLCKEVILKQEQLNCPVLGVCLGHQGIVHHFGGEVVGAPKIVHGKSSRINLIDSSPLFEGLQSGFEAMRYHSLVAAEEDFPSELKVTAREAADNLIMALQHRAKPLYGVQFHPESVGTPAGSKILRNFVERC